MTPHPRYLIVSCCARCPHFLDVWSFGKPAAKCGNSPRGDTITPDEQKTFPDWCPLEGSCPHSTASERDTEQLKKAIIEVLDTGFESSERDMALVLDRIEAWERGELP